jgi:hypothetical protein
MEILHVIHPSVCVIISDIPQQSVEFPELLEDIGRMMYKVADMTQELLNKMNPALNVSKSEKSEKHITTKQEYITLNLSNQ